METICKDKDIQRAIALDARRKLSNTQREMFSRKVSEHLMDLPFIKNTHVVLAYSATYDEVSLSAFAESAKELNLELAYPVSYKGGIMKAYVPDSDEAWENGKFGIRSPKENRSKLINPEDIDLVIVPCVAFDEGLRRLGHGAGYYDRYLPMCTKAKFVCVAFEAQKLDNIVVNQYDTPMDCVVTEEKIYWSE